MFMVVGASCGALRSGRSICELVSHLHSAASLPPEQPQSPTLGRLPVAMLISTASCDALARRRNSTVTLDSLAQDLERISPGRVERDVRLAERSQWRVGGSARVVVHPATIEEVVAIRRLFYRTGVEHLVIGGTTNLLFSDDGLEVPCIQIGSALSRLEFRDDAFVGEAGVWVPTLARYIMKAGRSGAEHICGIPGSLGGLICMNGGSQRKSIGDATASISSVNSVGDLVVRAKSQCGFGYRSSVYQANSDIIVSAHLKFDRVEPTQIIRARMLDILSDRRRKFPRKLPNCGSVFKSDPTLYEKYGPPGAIIERLGFKGAHSGYATVSPQHANFITTSEGASARDVLTLIHAIEAAARTSIGVHLEAEVRYVDRRGRIFPAHAVTSDVQ